MPLLDEGSPETLNFYGRLLFIPITNLQATGCGGGTIFDWMPEDSCDIYYIPVSITVIKIGPVYAVTT